MSREVNWARVLVITNWCAIGACCFVVVGPDSTASLEGWSRLGGAAGVFNVVALCFAVYQLQGQAEANARAAADSERSAAHLEEATKAQRRVAEMQERSARLAAAEMEGKLLLEWKAFHEQCEKLFEFTTLQLGKPPGTRSESVSPVLPPFGDSELVSYGNALLEAVAGYHLEVCGDAQFDHSPAADSFRRSYISARGPFGETFKERYANHLRHLGEIAGK